MKGRSSLSWTDFITNIILIMLWSECLFACVTRREEKKEVDLWRERSTFFSSLFSFVRCLLWLLVLWAMGRFNNWESLLALIGVLVRCMLSIRSDSEGSLCRHDGDWYWGNEPLLFNSAFALWYTDLSLQYAQLISFVTWVLKRCTNWVQEKTNPSLTTSLESPSYFF